MRPSPTHEVGNEVVATAIAGAFRDVPRRRRGSSGGIPLGGMLLAK